MIEMYKYGIQNGLQIHYDQNGRISKTCEMKDGLLHGEYKVFENGNLIEHCFFKENILHGQYKTYSKCTGRLQLCRFYLDGTLDGQWIAYTAYGRLAEQRVYSGGRLIEKRNLMEDPNKLF